MILIEHLKKRLDKRGHAVIAVADQVPVVIVPTAVNEEFVTPVPKEVAESGMKIKKVEDVAASSGKIIFGSDLTSGIYILSVKTAQEQINCKVIKY